MITGKISKETKKWLKSKGIDVWHLSEQINRGNFDRMKTELITKYIRPLLFRLKATISKYNNPSIVYSSMQLINTSIRYTYLNDRTNNRINNIKLNEKGLKVSKWTEDQRLKAKWIEEKANGVSVVRLPNGVLVWA